MLGDNIRKIRKERAISINKLSELSGISLGYISGLENNKEKNPTIEKLDKIAKVLNVNLEDLFKDERLEQALEIISTIEKITMEELDYKPLDEDELMKELFIKMQKSKLNKEEQQDLINYLDFIISKRKE